MPQTKFVLSKALARASPIVVLNKIDRPRRPIRRSPQRNVRPLRRLGARRASSTSRSSTPPAKKAGPKTDLSGERKDLTPLFDLVVRHVPEPPIATDAPFAMVATMIDSDLPRPHADRPRRTGPAA
jgi:GTP-binding protein